MKLLPRILLLCSLSLPVLAEDGFVPLFNGKDLSGWKSIRDEKKKGSGSFSVDADAKAMHVYKKAKDGEKQPIDCLYTEKKYSSYILKMEYKWLDRRFPPRETADRDAGLLFHVHGDMSKIWPNCLEMQLGESDATKTKNRYLTGDLWVIGKDLEAMNSKEGRFFYKPEAPLVSVGKGKGYDYSYATVNVEKDHGEWNEITLTVRAGKEAIFELNGQVVNKISDMTTLEDGKRVPMASGHIALQAEYAELLYRNIVIKELVDDKAK